MGIKIRGRKRRRTGDQLFGLPYRNAVSLVCGAGFLFGALVLFKQGIHWCPTVISGEPGQMEGTCTFGLFGVLIVLGVAMTISFMAVVGNFEETWHRRGILSFAAGYLMSGLWILAIHRIEIQPDHFVVRGPLNPIATKYSLNDGNEVQMRRTERRATWNWGRQSRRTQFTLHLVKPDGTESLLCSTGSLTPVWSATMYRLIAKSQQNRADPQERMP